MTAITKICKAESRKQHSHLNVFYFQIPAWWSSLVITTVRKQWRAIEEAGNRSGFWKKQVIFPDFPWGQMLWHWLSFSTSVYLNFSIFAMEIMILFFFFFFKHMKLEAYNLKNVLRLICVGPESQGVEHFKSSSIFQHMLKAHWDHPCIKN